MTVDQIIGIIDSGEIDKLKSTLELSKYAYFINDTFTQTGLTTGTINQGFHVKDLKQYNPKQHDVHDKGKRLDKCIKDDDGQAEMIVPVTRLSLAEQKKIVLLAATFLGSPTLSCTPAQGVEADMFSVLNTVCEDNKLNYKFKEISKTTMSERECAELWYTQEAEADYWEGTPIAGSKFKLRMRILSPSKGDTLFPAYDIYGDMVAFGRYYETVDTLPNSLVQQNKVCHFDVYTKDRFYFMTKGEKETVWTYNTEPTSESATPEQKAAAPKGIPNIIGKIPVIYYSQPITEWSDVQEMIERLEKKISNHGDSNDYFDSPIVVASGKVEGFSKKGEQGKLLQAENGATVSYLEAQYAPESMKMEIDNLIKFIHTYTHTPDISFENIKGLGTFSGIALKMFFMDAHLKAADKEEIFGQGVQRRINYLKEALAKISSKLIPALRLIVRPKFEYFLPQDVDGEVNTIVKAYEAGIISLQTAVKLNPLVEDTVSELGLIKAEKAAQPIPTPPTAP